MLTLFNTTRHTNTILKSFFHSSLFPQLLYLSNKYHYLIGCWNHIHKHIGKERFFYFT